MKADFDERRLHRACREILGWNFRANPIKTRGPMRNFRTGRALSAQREKLPPFTDKESVLERQVMSPISTLVCLALQVYTHAQLPHYFLGVDPTLAKGWASFLGCSDLCRPPHLWPDMGTQRGSCFWERRCHRWPVEASTPSRAVPVPSPPPTLSCYTEIFLKHLMPQRSPKLAGSSSHPPACLGPEKAAHTDRGTRAICWHPFVL